MSSEFARPIDTTPLSLKLPNTGSSARYRHPQNLNSTNGEHHPRFDLYSLGIMFIEISLWKTADMLSRKNNSHFERGHIS